MAALNLENSIVDERYEVRRRLNHGSYAEIYEAFDLERDRRPVILKALNTALQGTPERDLERTLVENFQNEAVALDRVSHPNIVRRLGHGTAADLSGTPFHYLVLEYMAGGDLMELCRRGALPLDEALFYFKQVCEALAEAHDRGVIHRDVKPHNLLLSADGRVIKITDFGVAKLGSSDPDAEVTRVGTDLYAPPEHNPGGDEPASRVQLTPSADVYSLAKTIYTAVAGRAPRAYARRPIAELPPEIRREPWGPPLLEILRRATAEHVSDRYATVRDFWKDLSALAAFADDGDEATHVRPREPLHATGPLPPVAPSPDFMPNVHEAAARGRGAPRIVVELDGGRARQPAVEPPAAPPARAEGKKPAPPPPEAEPYSYREDLRDLVGTGWRLRLVVLAAVLLLCASVAAVYFEVHRYMMARGLRQGTVTAQQLSLRDSPSGTANRISQLPYGTRVRIVAQDGQWYEVEVTEWGAPVENEQADRGWVSARHVAVEE